MSNFVVSARKYRPIRFNSVVGQPHIAQTLKNAIRQNHVAQAFLFCGPRGVGKTTCARILAKVLNCERPTADIEPCDECDSCRAFRENASLNVYELDAASNNSVEHIRALIEQVRFAPQSGRYKIYIIDEVHMLSQAAFNAFLKTLEEPPAYAIFILATTEKHKIIPTILSRCQIFDFNRIQVADMAGHLQHICEQEGITAEEEALHVIAQKADGALRDALSIFDRVVSFSGDKIRYQDVIEQLNILDYDYYFQIVEAIVSEDTPRLLLLFDTILRKGFDGDIFINGLAEHFRNILVCQNPATAQLLEVSGNIRQRYQEQARMIPTGLILSALHLANECDVHYKLARNKRLHVELTLIRMAYILQAQRLMRLPAGAALPSDAEKKNLDLSKSAEIPVEKGISTKTDTPKIEEKTAPDEQDAADKTPPAKTSFAEKLAQSKRDNLLLQVKKTVVEEQSKELPPPPPFTTENLRAKWDDYTNGISSPSTQAIFRSAKLAVSDDATTVRITVSGKMGQDVIQRDGELWKQLCAHFQKSQILSEFAIEEPAPPDPGTVVKKAGPMDDRAKYVHFLNQNPLVKELQKKFNLFPPKK